MSSPDELVDDSPPEIDPYEILGLEREATPEQVKSAYRKAALKNHPDKVSDDQRDEAKEKFQAIAFAYAILSDPARRKRYDTTGSTSESIIDSEGFNWSDYYREQFQDAISAEAIEKFAKKYKGSNEEKDDVLIAYENSKGDMDGIYESVMLSDVLEDDERFRQIIDEAIASEDVQAYKRYTKESKLSKAARVKAAKGEANEAEEYAKELGVHDKLFGDKKGKGKKKGKDSGEADLAALIKGNQQKRAGFLDDLAAKYGATSQPKKGKKRVVEEEEPSEEAFQAAAARLKKPKADESKSAKAGGLYPQYCLQRSPTFNTWCLMQASDVHALKTVPEYEVQNFYFYKNLPIKWARIIGIVVAVDDFPGRRIYTVDDSSGACIECTVATKTPPSDNSATNLDTNGWFTKRPQPQPPADCVDVDVGTVIDIKGGLAMFREEMQIRIEKVKILRSTEEEVALWEKRTRFRNEVLLPPWVLSERQIRKCKKEGMRDAESEERKRKRERRREERKKEEEEMRRKTEAAEAAAAQENRYRAYKLKKADGSRPMVQTSQVVTAVPTTTAAAAAPIVEDRYHAYKLRKGDGSRPIAYAGQVIAAVPTEATAASVVEDRYRAYSLKRGHSIQEQQPQRVARPAPSPAAEDRYTAYKIKKGGDSRPVMRPDATTIDTAAAEAVEDRYRVYKLGSSSTHVPVHSSKPSVATDIRQDDAKDFSKIILPGDRQKKLVTPRRSNLLSPMRQQRASSDHCRQPQLNICSRNNGL
ncbi:DnaJ domain-containing protein [Colletotrichum tamarilloi]|uniref:DnaJ domain-containing protein n=1 Tax=Colletotrichum tamarilloi TaxID=1209934 RepID=A0ABQ9R5N1_9PEZI|nr:DnaJ domain-containing protein [Colletotrichum tamarilloi]KAK1495380.1 DnaJ domain-containing protein [Colletotrichum tamarilloi]